MIRLGDLIAILDLHRQRLTVSVIARPPGIDRKTILKYINHGFVEWGDVFGDSVIATALLDRLLHHTVVVQIEGASYRLRLHADRMPEHIRSNAIISPPIVADDRSARPAPARAIYAIAPGVEAIKVGRC